jgi:hypothetical protein
MTLCNNANKSYTCSHVENFEQASRVETCFNHSLMVNWSVRNFLKSHLYAGRSSQKNHKPFFVFLHGVIVKLHTHFRFTCYKTFID